jgi:acyl-coenzyme A thioesterase PaaI-like protein
MFKKFFGKMLSSPEFMRRAMNFYAPLRGAGIQVVSIASDFSRVEVKMDLTRRNRNIMQTHFGGSLYAMADPFYMLILMKTLGSKYHVWDQQATIEFVAPGNATVYGTYEVGYDQLQDIQSQASLGEKVLYTFNTAITHADGSVVAKIEKVLYVRLKKKHRPTNP